jgi:hypothetical protein
MRRVDTSIRVERRVGKSIVTAEEDTTLIKATFARIINTKANFVIWSRRRSSGESDRAREGSQESDTVIIIISDCRWKTTNR